MIHDHIKYLLTAIVLKALSISPWFYHGLGNAVAARKRVQDGFPEYYPGRAKRFSARCEKHQAIRNGDRILEVGTEWVQLIQAVPKSTTGELTGIATGIARN
jgi:hypothetical protein